MGVSPLRLAIAFSSDGGTKTDQCLLIALRRGKNWDTKLN